MNFIIYRSYLKFKKENSQKIPVKIWISMLFLLGYIFFVIIYQIYLDLSFLIYAGVLLIVFLVLSICENNKITNESEELFFAKKEFGRKLFKHLSNYDIVDESGIIALQEWLKLKTQTFEKHVKRAFAILGTIIFSGLLAFSGSILPSVFDNGANVPAFIIKVIVWAASVIFEVVLLVLGIFASKYYDYKNMKLFTENLQDIIDYKLLDRGCKRKKIKCER